MVVDSLELSLDTNIHPFASLSITVIFLILINLSQLISIYKQTLQSLKHIIMQVTCDWRKEQNLRFN